MVGKGTSVRRTALTATAIAVMGIVFCCFTASAQEMITLIVGEQQTLDARDTVRVAVGDPNIADVKVIAGGRELLITGISSGTTTLTMWNNRNEKTTLQIKVIARDPKEVAREVRELLGDVEGISIVVVGEKVVLDGEVFRQKDLDRADKVVQMYEPQLVSLLEYNKAYLEMKRMIQVEFKFYEIDKNKATRFGINMSDLLNPQSPLISAQYSINSQSNEMTDNLNSDNNMDTETDTTSLNVSVTNDFNPLRIDSEDDKIRLMEEHQAVTRSGEKVYFVAGGEVPIAVEGTAGSAGYVEWKQYGTIINAQPEIDRINNIILTISVESSQLDWANAVSGYPAIKLNRSDTVVNMKSGQTLLMGGVFSTGSSRKSDGIPGFSKIPLLGFLFGAKEYTKNRHDGVLFITPSIINPVDQPGQNPRIQAVIDRFEEKDLML